MTNRSFFTSTQLKIYAILFMFIDHFAASLVYYDISTNYLNHFGGYSESFYIVLRSIGRLAFPIFAFLIAEGFYHTKNVNRYLTRLFIFALLSEVPFDLAFGNKLFYETQNIFFTLFLGLVAIILFERYHKKGSPLGFILVTVIGLLSILLQTDYDVYGVVLIFLLHYFRGNHQLVAFSVIFINVLISFSNVFQLFGILSLVFILLYNHRKGRNIKFIFYVFYPLHLILFYLIRINI